MPAAYARSGPRLNRPSLRRRGTALALAAALNLLILVVLLTINAARPPRPQFRGSPIVLDLGPDPAPAPKAATAERPTSAEPPPAAPAPPVRPPNLPSKVALPLIPLSKDELASADIARFGSSAGSAQASTAGDSERVGTAPNGEPLYAAQWYREPTDAEVGAYLPARMPAEGWGLVACRTVARYRVEDCVELGNSPPGSHLAGAVRQAAWQFLVRPPRVGGKELVGTWVQIRIDYRQARRD